MKISLSFVNVKTNVLMAVSFYKWLIFPALGMGLFVGKLSNNHPFHVSVVEINHNATDKTLEISCKIFTDDFEKVLAQNYKTKVDLINPPDKKAMDSLVKKYVFSRLSVSVDSKPGALEYIGFERDNEAVLSYVQVSNINSLKKIDITNKLMYDMFTDQVNIMHIIEKGERKSTKLDYPATTTQIQF